MALRHHNPQTPENVKALPSALEGFLYFFICQFGGISITFFLDNAGWMHVNLEKDKEQEFKHEKPNEIYRAGDERR